MSAARLAQAQRLFNVPGVPAHTVEHNVKGWLRSVELLGPKWHLANVQPHKAVSPTLGQLRERLAACIADGSGVRVVDLTSGETLRDRMELVIAEREIAAGLRTPPIGPLPNGPL